MVGEIGGLIMIIPRSLTPWGMRIFRYCESKGLTLQQLADKAGINKGTLLNQMQGKRYPRLDTWIEICEALSDTQEEFELILTRTKESIVEYEMATRRYKRKASRKQ